MGSTAPDVNASASGWQSVRWRQSGRQPGRRI